MVIKTFVIHLLQLNKLKRLLLALIAALTLPTALIAEVWIDEDGTTAIEIKEQGQISFLDTGSFYYFDQIFGNVRKNDIQLRVCLGSPREGMPSDCFSNLPTHYSFHNRGKTRALHVDLSNFPFLLSAFEEKLRLGETLKISIDDGDLYSAYTLNNTYKLKEEAMNIFKLSD